MTNAEKFEEVFGIQAPTDKCVHPFETCNKYTCIDYTDPRGERHTADCPHKEWWDKEYETPDRLPFE